MKKTSCKIAARNQPILSRMRELKAKHPFWGYRRLFRASEVRGQALPSTRSASIGCCARTTSSVKPHRQLKASRVPPRSKPRPRAPNQWWGIDMTEVMVEGFGWMYIVLVLDWYSKKIVGHCADLRSTSAHWREALFRGLNRQFPEGVRGHDLHLMSDNGRRAHLGEFHGGLQPTRGNPSLHQLPQPQGQRRHRTDDAHAQRRVALAAGLLEARANSKKH